MEMTEGAKEQAGEWLGYIESLVPKTEWNIDLRIFGEDPLGYLGDRIYEWRYALFGILIAYYMLESQADQKWPGD